jgi:hypothetical protein
MELSELKPFQAIRLTSGTGDSTMHIIVDENSRLYITNEEAGKESTVKRLSSDDEKNKRVYDYFLKSSGELVEDINPLIQRVKNSTHDWWSLMLLACLVTDASKS